MRLEKTAAIAEIVSSLAIVVTLAFLTMQTREMSVQTEQTNRAMFANSRATTMAADVNYLLAMANHSDISTAQISELPPTDLAKFAILMAAHFRIREFAWFQYQDGVLDQAAWESYLDSTVSMLNSSSTVVEIWERAASGLAPGFVAAVNNAADIE